MVRDISADVLKATRVGTLWMPVHFYELLSFLTNNGWESAWEEPERWALFEGGFIWSRYPLAVSENHEFKRAVEMFTLRHPLICIEVESLGYEGLSLDSESARRFFPNLPNYEMFSAADLWFFDM